MGGDNGNATRSARCGVHWEYRRAQAFSDSNAPNAHCCAERPRPVPMCRGMDGIEGCCGEKPTLASAPCRGWVDGEC